MVALADRVLLASTLGNFSTTHESFRIPVIENMYPSIRFIHVYNVICKHVIRWFMFSLQVPSS